VIIMAVRWYLAYPLSSRQVLELLAERGIDVSHRTVLNWVQTFGPQLAAEVRRHRRRVGRCWFVDDVFLFRTLCRPETVVVEHAIHATAAVSWRTLERASTSDPVVSTTARSSGPAACHSPSFAASAYPTA
jgi:hypothetical protein